MFEVHNASTTPQGASGSSVDPGAVQIMIVDDEPLNIAVVEGYLEMEGYTQVVCTDQPLQALPLIRRHRPDAVLLDIHMPGLSGIQILQEIRADPELAAIPVVILTASSSDETKLDALRRGATDLLAKPVHQGELLARLRNVLAMKTYHDRLCRHSLELEDAVRQRTAELEQSRMDVIRCLARAAEFRDDDTGKHIIRVGRYARLIGEALGLPRHDLDVLEPAAQLHDVGKIGIADSILLKPGRLTPEEFETMKHHCEFGDWIVNRHEEPDERSLRDHPELGARIMDAKGSPVLEVARRIALTHHERWDGSGYPRGLAGEEIPLEGRIAAVADVFDALSTRRPYKPPFPLEKCFAIMEEGRGTHFDPAVLDAFLTRREAVVQMQIELADDKIGSSRPEKNREAIGFPACLPLSEAL